MKTFDYRGVEVEIRLARYNDFDNLCVWLYAEGVAYAKASVNIEALPEGYFYADTNNLPDIEDFLIENRIAEPINAYARSGFCVYPLYKYTLNSKGGVTE